MEIKLEVISGIKGKCINDMIECLNRQIELVSLAKQGLIEREEFKERFYELEEARQTAKELKDDCNLIIEAYSQI